MAAGPSVERTWNRWETDADGVRHPVPYTETYQPTRVEDCVECRADLNSEARRLQLAGLDAPHEGWEGWRTSNAMIAAKVACNELLAGRRWCVFMRSAPGSGKTKLAQCTGVEAVRSGLTVAFWNMADLLDEIRNTYDRRADAPEAERDFLHGRVYKRDLVILDDLGTVKPTPWQTAITYDIVNNLYRRRDLHRLIVTSNVQPGREIDASGELIDERVLSRLRPGEVAIADAPDRRKEFDR